MPVRCGREQTPRVVLRNLERSRSSYYFAQATFPTFSRFRSRFDRAPLVPRRHRNRERHFSNVFPLTLPKTNNGPGKTLFQLENFVPALRSYFARARSSIRTADFSLWPRSSPEISRRTKFSRFAVSTLTEPVSANRERNSPVGKVVFTLSLPKANK